MGTLRLPLKDRGPLRVGQTVYDGPLIIGHSLASDSYSIRIMMWYSLLVEFVCTEWDVYYNICEASFL